MASAAFAAPAAPAGAGFLDELNSMGREFKQFRKGIDDLLESEPKQPTQPSQPQKSPAKQPPVKQPEARSAAPASHNSDREKVVRAQTMLNGLGYDAGPADGAYGTRTRNAIRAFQRDRNLPQHGNVTDPLIARLGQEAEARGIAVAGKETDIQNSQPPAAASSGGGMVAPAPNVATPSPAAAGASGASQPAPLPSTGSKDQRALAQAHGLSLARGLPVVGGGRYNLTDEEMTAISRFFDFIELRLDPSLLDRRALCWARTHLPAQAWSKYLIVGTKAVHVPGHESVAKELVAWKGANEFERNRARDAFLAEHGATLRAKAIAMPLEVVVVREYRLPEYDREKGGFDLGFDYLTNNGFSFDNLRTQVIGIPASACSGDFEFEPPATTVPAMWKIDAAQAERTLKTLRAEQRASAPPQKKIYVGMAFRFRAMPDAREASPANAQPKLPPFMDKPEAKAEIRKRQGGRTPVWSEIASLGIYQDPDLERLIVSLPVGNAKQPVMLSGIPDTVPVPSVLPFDEASLALLLLRDHGDVLDAGAWQHLMVRHAEQDAIYYKRQRDVKTGYGRLYASNQTSGFDDSYVPFFPNTFRAGLNTQFRAEQIALFRDWMMKRARNLPAEMVLRAPLRRGGRDYSVGWAPLKDGAFADVTRALQGKGYSVNQLLRLDAPASGSDHFDHGYLADRKLERRPVLVLPNIVTRYLPSEAELEQAGKAGAQTVEFVVGTAKSELVPVARKHTRAPGRQIEAFAVHGTPVRMRLIDSRTGKALFDKKYQVAALPPNRLTTGADAGAPPVKVPSGAAMPLSAEAVDLLVAKYLPQSLSDADYRRMMVARWDYEASVSPAKGEPDWGRFFIPGKPEPTGQQQATLLERFKDWTAKRAALLPEKFSLHYRLVRLNGGNPVSPIAPNTRGVGGNGMDSQIIVNSCRSESRSRPALVPACAYLENALKNAPQIHPFGLGTGFGGPRLSCGTVLPHYLDAYCKGREAQFEKVSAHKVEPGFRDIFVFDKEIFFPAGRHDLAGASGSSVDMVLEIAVPSVRTADRPLPEPFAEARKRYAAFREGVGLDARGAAPRADAPAAATYFLFDAKLLAARLVKNKTHEPVAELDLRPARTLDLDSLQVPDAKAAVPDAPFGPDIVGLRLGMRFAEADEVIRAHMKVGQVLTRVRSRDMKAIQGDFPAFSSGRAYISADAREIIVLYDEPPSAPEIVLGVTRRLGMPGGQLGPAQLLAKLRQKYGQETWTGRDGKVGWGAGLAQKTTNDTLQHACLPGTGNSALRDWVGADGAPVASRPAPTPGRSFGSLPTMQMYTSPKGRTCGAALGMAFAPAHVAGGDDRLTLHLADLSLYTKLYDESRRRVAAGGAPAAAPASDGPQATDPRIKF